MTEHAQGWPFLVARGRRRGYRTLLAPAFLTERDLQDRLSEATSGAEPGRILSIELDCPGVGPLSVMYTIDGVRAADVNGDGPGAGGAPTDEHGRPLELLYGIVSRRPPGASLDLGDLQAARSEAVRCYRRFLAAEDSFGVDASSPFALRTTAGAPESSGRGRLPEPAPPLPRRFSSPTGAERPAPAAPRRRVVRPTTAAARIPGGALVATALVIVVVLFGWRLWPSPAPASGVRVLEPLACGAQEQVQLHAVIQAGGVTTVRYHWEPPALAAPVGGTKLEFKAAGREPISGKRTLSPGDTASKASFLVIDAPSSQRHKLRYRASCNAAAAAGAPPPPDPPPPAVKAPAGGN